MVRVKRHPYRSARRAACCSIPARSTTTTSRTRAPWPAPGRARSPARPGRTRLTPSAAAVLAICAGRDTRPPPVPDQPASQASPRSCRCVARTRSASPGSRTESSSAPGGGKPAANSTDRFGGAVVHREARSPPAPRLQRSSTCPGVGAVGAQVWFGSPTMVIERAGQRRISASARTSRMVLRLVHDHVPVGPAGRRGPVGNEPRGAVSALRVARSVHERLDLPVQARRWPRPRAGCPRHAPRTRAPLPVRPPRRRRAAAARSAARWCRRAVRRARRAAGRQPRSTRRDRPAEPQQRGPPRSRPRRSGSVYRR